MGFSQGIVVVICTVPDGNCIPYKSGDSYYLQSPPAFQLNIDREGTHTKIWFMKSRHFVQAKWGCRMDGLLFCSPRMRCSNFTNIFLPLNTCVLNLIRFYCVALVLTTRVPFARVLPVNQCQRQPSFNEFVIVPLVYSSIILCEAPLRTHLNNKMLCCAFLNELS